MSLQVIDSHLHCPRSWCGKRLVLEIGQDDATGAGDMRATHLCLSCDYREEDTAWTRPIKRAKQLVAASRLARQRLEGWTHELVYDDSPWPEEDWSDA
jgi:hypothetical protein